MDSGIEYEFRTTVAPYFDEEDFRKIGLMINGARNYFIQQFKTTPTMIDSEMAKLESLDRSKLEGFKRIMEEFVKNVSLRGI